MAKKPAKAPLVPAKKLRPHIWSEMRGEISRQILATENFVAILAMQSIPSQIIVAKVSYETTVPFLLRKICRREF